MTVPLDPAPNGAQVVGGAAPGAVVLSKDGRLAYVALSNVDRVAVVSLAGETAVSRAGLSQLTNLGLPELAARSETDYVNIAEGLAGDLPRLAELRSTLRGRSRRSSTRA